jgi:hypothetical protein
MQGRHDPDASQWDLGPIPCRLATGSRGTTADGPCGSARRCGAPASAMSGVRRRTVGARRRAPPGARAARLLARADMAGVAARGSYPQALRVDAVAAGAHVGLQSSAARKADRPAVSAPRSGERDGPRGAADQERRRVLLLPVPALKVGIGASATTHSDRVRWSASPEITPPAERFSKRSSAADPCPRAQSRMGCSRCRAAVAAVDSSADRRLAEDRVSMPIR